MKQNNDNNNNDKSNNKKNNMLLVQNFAISKCFKMDSYSAVAHQKKSRLSKLWSNEVEKELIDSQTNLLPEALICYQHIYLYIYTFIFIFISLYIYLSIFVSIYLSILFTFATEFPNFL